MRRNRRLVAAKKEKSMKLTLLSGFAVLIATGCSTGAVQATQRMGRWEEHSDFRSCIQEAVPDSANYGQNYKSCITLEVTDDQAQKCVHDMTPTKDLSEVNICERQLRDLMAYEVGARASLEEHDPGLPVVPSILPIIF
jgi:hypothetical protein